MMTNSNLLHGFLYLIFILAFQIINGSEVSYKDEGLQLNHLRIKRNSSANDKNSEITERKTIRNNETSKDQEIPPTTKIWTTTIITSVNLTNNCTTESSNDETNKTFINHEIVVTKFKNGENTVKEEGSGDGSSVDGSSDTAERNEASGNVGSVDGGSDTDDLTLVITNRHSITTVQEDNSSNIVSILVPISLVFVVLSLMAAAVCIMKQKLYSVLPNYYE